MLKTATLQISAMAAGAVLVLADYPYWAITAFLVFISSLLTEVFITTIKGNLNMALVLTDEQKVGLSLAPRTAAGNPASLDGAPVWSVSDPAVLDLVVSDDGLSATVSAKGLGAAQVSVVADADLDSDETRELTGVLDVLVVAAEAATLGVTAGIPDLK